MSNTEKARFFCHTHTNLFLQKHCKQCGRGMCHTCLHNNNTFCPSCIKEFYLSSEAHANKKEILWMLGAGILVYSIFISLQFHENNTNYPDFYSESFLAFFLGTSLCGTYFFIRDHEIMSTIRKVPFIGFKLSIIVLIIIIITGIPIFFQLYKFVSNIIKPKRI